MRSLIIQLLFFVLLIPSAQRLMADKKQEKGFQINAYLVSEQALEKPVEIIDEKGEKKLYHKVYIVELKCDLGEPTAIPIDIFIGDFKIPEYGRAKEGLYFKVYEESALDSLEGKPIGYGIEGQRIKMFDLIFEPGKLKPYPKLDQRKDR